MSHPRHVVPRWHEILVAALAAAASIVSLGNGFALDDVPIVLEDARLHSLTEIWRVFGQPYWPPEAGDALYRPLTSLAFALQWAAGGGSPVVFHAVNVALYVAVSISLFRLASRFMDERAAAMGAAVFAVHPLHVEAVANVVGQAELWVALLLFGGLSFFVAKRERGRLTAADIGVLSAIYVVALMFKEHAVIFPAVILAADLLLPLRANDTMRARFRSIAPLLVALSVVAIAFVLVRAEVLGRFAGGSTATVFIGQSFGVRLLTMLAVVPEWLRLFFWPASLSADYSPPRIATQTSFNASMIPAVIALAGAAVIAWKVRRSNQPVSFAIALTGICLVIPSNTVVVTGFVLAERALFLASAGVALVMGIVLWALMSRAADSSARRMLVAVTCAILLAGVVRSSARSTVWRDNETLFRQTVRDVPASYRAHLMLGELLWDKGEKGEALTELLTAVRLSSKQDAFVRWFAADRFHAAGLLPTAMALYRESLAIKPSDQRTRYGAAMCAVTLGMNEEARAIAVEGLRRDPTDRRFATIVSDVDSAAKSPSI
jgi:hypothetical protein